MNYLKLPNDPVLPKRRRRPSNKSSRQNPNQLVFRKNFRGVLKRNRNPSRTNPNPPKFIGVCRLEDKEYWISAWPGEYRDDGRKYLKLIFQAKEPPGEPGERPYEHSMSDKEFSADLNVSAEEIPF